MPSTRNPYGRHRPTERKKQLLDHLALGLTPAQAAKAMQEDPRAVSELVKHDRYVIAELEKMEEQRRKDRRITREKVEDIVLRAIDVAESIESPGDMIRGAAELSKLNGLYEPEKKELVIEGSIEHVQKELTSLSDAELLQMLEEERHAIEGEFERLEIDDNEAKDGEHGDSGQPPE